MFKRQELTVLIYLENMLGLEMRSRSQTALSHQHDYWQGRIEMKIDAQIREIDGIICRHINSGVFLSRGEISQDILAQLRNFVEHVMLKFYAGSGDVEDSYDNIIAAIRSSKTRADLKPLWQLHDLLKISASHYSVGSDASERLMLKYYECLLRIRDLMHEKCSLDVLSNLE